MLVVLASIKGSPGVTSTALALAACWPREVLLLEADPSGGDVSLRCTAADGGAVRPGRGLVRLVTHLRSTEAGDGSQVDAALRDQCEQLACGVGLVPGVSSAGQAKALAGLWPAVARALGAATVDVIVDLGRIDRDSPGVELARRASLVLVVAAAAMDSVVHLDAGLAELLPHVSGTRGGAWGSAVTLEGRGGQRAVGDLRAPVVPVLVGADGTAEQDCADLDAMLRRSGRPVAPTVSVPHDPRALRRLERGERPSGRLGRTLLLRRAGSLAQVCAAESPAATAVVS